MEKNITIQDINVRIVTSHVTKNDEYLFTIDGHEFSVVIDEPLAGGMYMHADFMYEGDAEDVIATEWYEMTNPDNDIWCPRYKRTLVQDTEAFATLLIAQAKEIINNGYWIEYNCED